MNKTEIKNIANNISNFMYEDNLEAVEQLVELFNEIARRPNHCPLYTWKDYVRMYDDSFYTYTTWEDLVESEAEQNYGLTREECEEQMGKTIWQLPCGWYVQMV